MYNFYNAFMCKYYNNTDFFLVFDTGHLITKNEWEKIKNTIDKFYNDPESNDYIKNHNERIDDEQRLYHETFNKRLAEEKRKNRIGYIYFIKCGNAIKIGRAKNPENRLKDIQINSPHSVELVHKIKSDNSILGEKFFQVMYANKNINGEWFQLNDQDIKMTIETFGNEFNEKDIKEWICQY